MTGIQHQKTSNVNDLRPQMTHCDGLFTGYIIFTYVRKITFTDMTTPEKRLFLFSQDYY